eukprot:2720468-Rhodomonas_salina.1
MCSIAPIENGFAKFGTYFGAWLSAAPVRHPVFTKLMNTPVSSSCSTGPVLLVLLGAYLGRAMALSEHRFPCQCAGASCKTVLQMTDSNKIFDLFIMIFQVSEVFSARRLIRVQCTCLVEYTPVYLCYSAIRDLCTSGLTTRRSRKEVPQLAPRNNGTKTSTQAAVMWCVKLKI